MLTENTSREWIVASPPVEAGKPPIEIARIAAGDANKLLMLLFNRSTYSLKHLRGGIPLAPIFARNLGEALIKAADMADAAWTEPEPAPNA